MNKLDQITVVYAPVSSATGSELLIVSASSPHGQMKPVTVVPASPIFELKDQKASFGRKLGWFVEDTLRQNKCLPLLIDWDAFVVDHATLLLHCTTKSGFTLRLGAHTNSLQLWQNKYSEFKVTGTDTNRDRLSYQLSEVKLPTGSVELASFDPFDL